MIVVGVRAKRSYQLHGKSYLATWPFDLCVSLWEKAWRVALELEFVSPWLIWRIKSEIDFIFSAVAVPLLNRTISGWTVTFESIPRCVSKCVNTFARNAIIQLNTSLRLKDNNIIVRRLIYNSDLKRSIEIYSYSDEVRLWAIHSNLSRDFLHEYICDEPKPRTDGERERGRRGRRWFRFCYL